MTFTKEKADKFIRILKKVFQTKDNLVKKITEESTHTTYPSAKAVQQTIDELPEQVQSDWNTQLDTDKSFIHHKPYIPEYLADLKEDSDHRTVTDNEKTKWDKGGSFEQIQTNWDEKDIKSKAFIQNKPTIPQYINQLIEDTNHRTVTDNEKEIWDNKASRDIKREDIQLKSVKGEGLLILCKTGLIVNAYLTLNHKSTKKGQGKETYELGSVPEEYKPIHGFNYMLISGKSNLGQCEIVFDTQGTITYSSNVDCDTATTLTWITGKE